MLDQIFEKGIREALLVAPLGITKNSVKGIRVGLLNAAHGFLECMADVGASGANVVPVALFGHLKAMVLRKKGKIEVTARLFKRNTELFVVNVGKAFEKQKRKNVRFEISGINRAPQNIGRLL